MAELGSRHELEEGRYGDHLYRGRPEYRGIPFHRRHVGLNHLAFHVGSREKLDRIMRRLAVRNVPLLYADKTAPIKEGEKEAVYFEDPDRIKVELVCEERRRRTPSDDVL